MELAQFREHCLSFIESHFSSISRSEVFLELPFHILLEIILADDLIASSEIEIFNALISWIEHNNSGVAEPESIPSSSPSSSSEKKNQVEQLLECIRYPLMDKEFLAKLEIDCAFIKQSPALVSLVRNYLRDESTTSSSLISVASTFRPELPALDEEDFRFGF